MAARRTLLQVSIAIVNLVIAALVFTSIWPFPSGDFKVRLPSASEIHWTYSNGTVQVIAPFTVDNSWIYDVNDLDISYLISNESSKPLAGDTLSVGSIPAGSTVSSQVEFNIDLAGLYSQGIDWMVFHDDMLYFRLEATCWYTMNLIHFDAVYQVSVPWDPLIQGYGISDVTYPATLPSPGTPVSVTVDYWLATSRLLSSLPPAAVTVSYYGDDTLLGSAQTTVQLGGNYSSTATVEVTPAYYGEYWLDMQFQFGGYTVSQRWNLTTPAPPWGVIP
jgi:hypothetical protein